MALKNIYFDTWKEYVNFVKNCQKNIDSVTYAKIQEEEKVDKEIDNQIENAKLNKDKRIILSQIAK